MSHGRAKFRVFWCQKASQMLPLYASYVCVWGGGGERLDTYIIEMNFKVFFHTLYSFLTKDSRHSESPLQWSKTPLRQLRSCQCFRAEIWALAILKSGANHYRGANVLPNRHSRYSHVRQKNFSIQLPSESTLCSPIRQVAF